MVKVGFEKFSHRCRCSTGRDDKSFTIFGRRCQQALQRQFKTILEQVNARKPHIHTRRPHSKTWLSPDLPVDFRKFDAISPDIMKRSLLKCFITNALDGTEDDIFLEEMDESEPFADDEGMESTADKEGDLFNAMLKMKFPSWKWMNKNTTIFLVKKTLMKVISIDFN